MSGALEGLTIQDLLLLATALLPAAQLDGLVEQAVARARPDVMRQVRALCVGVWRRRRRFSLPRPALPHVLRRLLSCVCVGGMGFASVWTPRQGWSPATGRIRCLAAQRHASQRTSQAHAMCVCDV